MLTKCHVDKMSSFLNWKLNNAQVEIMVNQQNIKLTKYQVEEIVN
jgi:hypothetical protein